MIRNTQLFTGGAMGLALCLLSSSLSAQVSQGGQPEGLLRPIGTATPTVVAPVPDVATYLAQDEARGHRPLRYGALVEVGVGIADGAWTTLRDGSRVWRLEIVSPGAKSLAVEFDRFELPTGVRMFVYDEQVETVLGAYTGENRHEDGSFVFEPFPGDRLTIELDVPAGVTDPELRTTSVRVAIIFHMFVTSAHRNRSAR
jgi:hypothetical protein